MQIGLGEVGIAGVFFDFFAEFGPCDFDEGVVAFDALRGLGVGDCEAAFTGFGGFEGGFFGGGDGGVVLSDKLIVGADPCFGAGDAGPCVTGADGVVELGDVGLAVFSHGRTDRTERTDG